MASRNLPPSFFNAHYHAKLAYSHPEASGLYSDAYAQVRINEPTTTHQWNTLDGLVLRPPRTQGLHHLAAHASSQDPWQYAAQATATSSYHRSVQDLVNSAGSYSSSPASRLQSQYSLFLNSPSTRLHSGQIKAEPGNPWGGGGEYPGHGPATVPEFPAHPLDRNYSPHPYTNMSSAGTEDITQYLPHQNSHPNSIAGLEAAGQEAPKDLYWPTF